MSSVIYVARNGQVPEPLDALVWALTELMIGAQTWVREPKVK